MVEPEYELVDVNESNLEEYDFLCKKSDKKGEGYRNKASWIRERFKEGMQQLRRSWTIWDIFE